MKKSHLIAAALSVLLLSSCANKAQTGAAGGAAAGAIAGQAIGKNTGATLIGAAVGGMLGYAIGNEMDKYDQQQLNQAYEKAQTGQTVNWTNPDNNNQYRVTPLGTFQNSDKRDCRTAEIEAVIDGRTERTRSTACRDSYGNWELQGR